MKRLSVQQKPVTFLFPYISQMTLKENTHYILIDGTTNVSEYIQIK